MFKFIMIIVCTMFVQYVSAQDKRGIPKPPVSEDPQITVVVQTPNYRLEASDCNDLVTMAWVEPGDRHFGKVSTGGGCDTVEMWKIPGTSPVGGAHYTTLDLFGDIEKLYFECAVTGIYRNNVTVVDMFCMDDPVFNTRR